MNTPIIKHSTMVWFALALSACGGKNDASGNPVPPPPSTAGWTRQAGNPLIAPKLTSTTQDFGPADPTVLFDTEDNTWKAWFSSTLKDTSTSIETMIIKYSESPDGVAWSAPLVALQVSSDSMAWDYNHVETPTVIKNPNPSAPAGQKFMMWYAGANTTLAPSQGRPATFPYYQIGLAFSDDGKSFTRHTPGLNNKPGLILEANAGLFGTGLPGVFGDGVVADPEVIYRNNLYHMWFSSYVETAPVRTPLAFGIAHATSTDGITWSAPHANPLPTLTKSGEVAGGQQPSVLFNPAANRYEMWFSNDTAAEKVTIPCSFNTVNGFWRALSSDGVTWVPDYSKRDLIYDPQYAYESLGFLTGVKVVLDNGIYRAYYSAWGTEQIPDNTVYLCPDQQGGLIPGVLTLNRATFTPL